MKYIHIHPLDNVVVALEDLKKGDPVSVTAKTPAGLQSTEAPCRNSESSFGGRNIRTRQVSSVLSEQHGCREIAIFKDGVTL